MSSYMMDGFLLPNLLHMNNKKLMALNILSCEQPTDLKTVNTKKITNKKDM